MFPAYVGMNRLPVNLSILSLNVPRIRGDEPTFFAKDLDKYICSPHTWG